MDAIRELAISDFATHDCFHTLDCPPAQGLAAQDANNAPSYRQLQDSAFANQVDLQLVQVTARASSESVVQVKKCSEQDIVPQLRQPINDTAIATLKLVVIPQDTKERRFVISRHVFLGIAKECEFDPAVLHLLRYPVWGNFGFRRDDGTITYYAGNVLYVACWTFNPATTATKGILVPRSTVDVAPARETLARFLSILRTQKNHIFTPHTLTFIQVVQLTHSIEKLKFNNLRTLGEIELFTGHGLWTGALLNGQEGPPSQTLSKLKKTSKVVGNMVLCYTRYVRHTAFLDLLLRDMDEDVKRNYETSFPNYSDSQRDRYNHDIKYREEGIIHLERHIENLKTALTYELDRVKSQATVIASLISHEDARTSKEIGEASKKLAEAARKDSSSMKTIAVMTMLFLPSTFLATLFAIPSMQADQLSIGQPGSWIFWIVAVPLTALVFMVWVYLSYGITISLRKKQAD